MDNQEKINVLLEFSACTSSEKKEMMKEVVDQAPEEIREIAKTLRDDLKEMFPKVPLGEDSIIELLACIGMNFSTGTIFLRKEKDR